MAVLDVLPYPNPFLRRRASDVTRFDDELRTIVSDMEETMAEQDGIGLAATQVGIDLRLLILSPYAFGGEDDVFKPNVVVINPELVWASSETQIGDEGCLSFPGVFIQVERPLSVRISALNVHGERFEITGEGLGARALLHEIDHLDGVVMIDHISFLQRKRALKKHQRNQTARKRTVKSPKKMA